MRAIFVNLCDTAREPHLSYWAARSNLTIQRIGSHAPKLTSIRMKTQVFCDGRAKVWDKLARESDNLLAQNKGAC
jgi:hypothetical protein